MVTTRKRLLLTFRSAVCGTHSVCCVTFRAEGTLWTPSHPNYLRVQSDYKHFSNCTLGSIGITFIHNSDIYYILNDLIARFKDGAAWEWFKGRVVIGCRWHNAPGQWLTWGHPQIQGEWEGQHNDEWTLTLLLGTNPVLFSFCSHGCWIMCCSIMLTVVSVRKAMVWEENGCGSFKLSWDRIWVSCCELCEL